MTETAVSNLQIRDALRFHVPLIIPATTSLCRSISTRLLPVSKLRQAYYRREHQPAVPNCASSCL